MMRKNRRILAVAAFFAVFGMSGGFALDVTDRVPQVSNPTVQSALDTAWSSVVSQMQDLVKDIDDKPENLIRAFGTSSVYTSQGATQAGYGLPKHFNVSVGPMAGIKYGAGLGELSSYFGGLADEMMNEGDAAFGMSASIYLQYTQNMSFLLPGLSMGLKGGFFKLGDSLLEGLSFDTFCIGVVGNYQIVKEKDLVPKLVKWRGLSVGTGVMFQSTNVKYALDLDSIDQDIGGGGTISVDPKLALEMANFTITVPLEVSTAIQLLSFLNITAGVGVDFGFGKSDMSMGLDADVNLKDLPSGIYQTSAGELAVLGGGDMAPKLFNFKLMTGVGFKFGPVYIDVPLVYYPGLEGTTGLSAGITLGVTL